MALASTTRDVYERATSLVPEHDKKVNEIRDAKGNGLYYLEQRILNTKGHIVGLHDRDGEYWVDELLVEQITLGGF